MFFQKIKFGKKLALGGLLSFFCLFSFSLNYCGAGSLEIPNELAPNHVPKFDDEYIEKKWRNNDEMLRNLSEESLIWRIVRIAKYGLGGIFMLFLGIYTLAFLSAGDKTEAVSNYNKQIIYSFVGFVILALAEPFATALNPLDESNVVGTIGTDQGVQRVAAMVGYTYRAAAHLIQYVLGGVALIAMGIAILKMVFSAGDEEEIKLRRKIIVWSAVGLILATGISVVVDNVLAPTEPLAIADPIDEHKAILDLNTDKLALRIIILNYVKYFQTFLGAVAVLMLSIIGYKMVTAAGNEEALTKQRKMLVGVFLGLTFILFAEVFVSIFLPLEKGTVVTPGLAQIESFSVQMGGMTNFLLTFGAALAVLAFLVGGLFLSTAALNQEQAEKGKKIMLAAGLGLVLLVAAYALVHTIFSGMATSESNFSIQTNL